MSSDWLLDHGATSCSLSYVVEFVKLSECGNVCSVEGLNFLKKVFCDWSILKITLAIFGAFLFLSVFLLLKLFLLLNKLLLPCKKCVFTARSGCGSHEKVLYVEEQWNCE